MDGQTSLSFASEDDAFCEQLRFDCLEGCGETSLMAYDPLFFPVAVSEGRLVCFRFSRIAQVQVLHLVHLLHLLQYLILCSLQDFRTIEKRFQKGISRKVI